jgi:hypothetical protein
MIEFPPEYQVQESLHDLTLEYRLRLMRNLFAQIQELIERGEVRISSHGYDELIADDILLSDVIASVPAAQVIEV